MDVYEAIQKRRSVRRFLNAPVEKEKLERVLEAARLAPSASNLQEWRFVVVQDAETKSRIADAAAHQDFVAEAPVIIVCCADTDEALMPSGFPSYQIDLALAVDHLSLAAEAEELGTCWIGSFNPGRVRAILKIPETIKLIALLPLGYPEDAESVSKNRLPKDKVIFSDRWEVT